MRPLRLEPVYAPWLHLLSLSDDKKYVLTVKEEAEISRMLFDIFPPPTPQHVAQLLLHLTNPLYRANRNVEAWYAILRVLARIIQYGL